jgi:fucose 4-O-acetylase-like acetyltransferase
MFGEIEYKLLISGYMSRDEYIQLIKKYMDEFDIPYITAKQYICREQIKKFEHDKKIKYYQAYLNTYYDIIENGYNISLL